ncbi:MAG: MerC domain-containing protein [Saprospiraceae bacterium]|nr:MerC domain-containing protein [Saprospiraceae bacterium]
MRDIISNIDFWGCTTSLLCAVHCAALPVMFSLGVVSTHHWMAHPLFEAVIIAMTFVFVYKSILRQYLEDRNNGIAVIMAIFGFGMIAVHHFFHAYATPIVVVGGFLLAMAHFYNITHNHSCSNRVEIN